MGVKFTAENAKEKGRKGGIKSGATRRRNREIKDIAKTLMQMPLKDGELDNITNLENIREKNLTAAESMFIAQIIKGMKGDTRATEFCFRASDLMPDQKVNVEAEITENTGYLDSITTQLINYQDAAKMFNENNKKED